MARTDPDETFSAPEELAHSLTHGAGLLLGIVALILMVVFASQRGSTIHVVSCTIFGATLVVLYASSTLYHALPSGRGITFFRAIQLTALAGDPAKRANSHVFYNVCVFAENNRFPREKLC
jgi:hemolysin III